MENYPSNADDLLEQSKISRLALTEPVVDQTTGMLHRQLHLKKAKHGEAKWVEYPGRDNGPGDDERLFKALENAGLSPEFFTGRDRDYDYTVVLPNNFKVGELLGSLQEQGLLHIDDMKGAFAAFNLPLDESRGAQIPSSSKAPEASFAPLAAMR